MTAVKIFHRGSFIVKQVIQFQWNSKEGRFPAYALYIRKLSNIYDGTFFRKKIAVLEAVLVGKELIYFDTVVTYNIDTYSIIVDIYLKIETFLATWEQNFPKFESNDVNQNSEYLERKFCPVEKTVKKPKGYWKLSFLFFIFLNFMKTRPNPTNATLIERFNRDIQDHKFVKVLEKLTQNFARVVLWVNNQIH